MAMLPSSGCHTLRRMPGQVRHVHHPHVRDGGEERPRPGPLRQLFAFGCDLSLCCSRQCVSLSWSGMHVHVQQTQQRRKVHFRRQELPAWRAAPLLALGSQPAAHPRHSPLHVMRAGRLATLLAYEAAAAARPALERVPVGLINLRAVAAVWAVPEAVPQVALAVAAARRHRHPCMAAAGEQAPARARASVRARRSQKQSSKQ